MRCHWSSASSFLLLILLFFEPLSAQRGEFSLEQVMSAGFPSEMTAAPVGGAVAWVINERGVRNIWIARAPDYRGRQLTRYKNDDGQTISQLPWTPDASALVFVRGDGPNRRGELPNPLSLPEGTGQVILKLANRGFVVLSVNYRSGIGYGMEFREALTPWQRSVPGDRPFF